MKRAIYSVLAACSVAIAGEPESASKDSSSNEAFSAMSAERLQRLMPEGWMLRPDGKAQGPQGQVVPVQQIHIAPPTTCYFIRTLRPVSPEELNQSWQSPGGPESAKPRLVPLNVQSRVAGVIDMPACAQGGKPIQAVLR